MKDTFRPSYIAQREKQKWPIIALILILAIAIFFVVRLLVNDKPIESETSDTAVLSSGVSLTSEVTETQESTLQPLSDEEYRLDALQELNSGLELCRYKQVVFGESAVYCLDTMGTLYIYATNQAIDATLEDAYSSWPKMEQIILMPADPNHQESLFGIDKEGNVYAPADGTFPVYDVSNLHNVVQLDALDAYSGMLIALLSNGTASSTCVVGTWDSTCYSCDCTCIASYLAEEEKIMGVTQDGLVISLNIYGDNTLFYDRTSNTDSTSYKNWSDIKTIAICNDTSDFFGLTNGGRVLYGGSFGSWGIFTGGAVESLENIVDISAGSSHIVALRADGTVFSYGENRYGECDVDEWKDIVRIEAVGFTTVGYTSDGRIYYAGYNCIADA